MKRLKGPPFNLTARSVATPLSFNEIRKKYGASAKDAAEILGFVWGSTTDAVRYRFYKKSKDKLIAGKARASTGSKSKKADAKARYLKTRSTKFKKAKKS